jgi:hypothetical protein
VKVGDIYKSNEWGDVEIVDYENSKNVTIKFVNTGNTKIAMKDNIEKGLVKDSQARNEYYQNKRDEEKAKRVAEENYARELQQKCIEAERGEVEERKAAKSRWFFIVRELKCHTDADGKILAGTVHEDMIGFRFQVITKVHGARSWNIWYFDSGNTYQVPETAILSGRVLDKKNEDALALDKLRRKTEAVTWYEANREQRIKKASEYQRNNPERTRTRNRNRRARRDGAEGSHTLQELSALRQQQDNKCACCGIELDDTAHVDHRIPLARGGTNYISNLQWLCAFCNVSKNASLPDEWQAYSSSIMFKKRRLERLSNEHEDWKSIVQSMPLLAEFLLPVCSELVQPRAETCQ